LELIRREGRAASSLNQPNICTMFDVGEQDGQQFIVMEQAEGRPISRLLADVSDRVDAVLNISVQPRRSSHIIASESVAAKSAGSEIGSSLPQHWKR
jgi:serine/threonine protein kinase